jgi:hypothetical protein
MSDWIDHQVARFMIFRRWQRPNPSVPDITGTDRLVRARRECSDDRQPPPVHRKAGTA